MGYAALKDAMPTTVDPEFAALIPPLSPDEYRQLEENIKRDGCRDKLVTWRGLLLDGHNRKQICDANNLTYSTIEIELPDRDAAFDWIDANQLGRRNLTPDQRTLLIGRRYNRAKKKHGGQIPGSLGQNVPSFPRTSKRIADESRVDEKTVRRAGKAAEFVATLPKPQQEAIQRGEVKIVEAKRQARKAQVVEAAKLPSAKYRVIYADPPWKYGDGLTEAYGGTQYHYPSMTITELCNMPVAELAEDNAVLFLWVTSPLLDEFWPILKAWNFQYKACFVWDKIKHNMGHYNSVRHEFLMICTRGSCLPDSSKLIDSVQSIERTAKHSEKPEEFRAIIDGMYSVGKRIELFARTKAKGWDCYGNDPSTAAD